MIHKFFIPWIIIIAIVVFITIIVAGVITVSTKRRRAELSRDGEYNSGYNSTPYSNNPNPYSGDTRVNSDEVPRNYCPYCGIKLYQGSSYCANCGRTVNRLSN